MKEQQKLDINDPLEVLETASNILYRVRAMICTAIIIGESTALDFEDPVFKVDSVAYQLDALHELVKQSESLFENAVSELFDQRKKESG